ncbi:hypothetical protein PPYR_15559, partial [Photinus pyralis]
MTEKIIQWNCNGVVQKYCDLKTLLTNQEPVCVCLQETHLKHRQPYQLKDYNIIRKDDVIDDRARGGVAILTRQDVRFQPILLNTGLQAVA